MVDFEQHDLPEGQPIQEREPIDPAFSVENAKLMQKAGRKALSFTIAAAIVVLIVILRQGQHLFIFNFADQNLNATASSRFFSFVTYAFLIFTAAYALHFGAVMRRRRTMSEREAYDSFALFKKKYDTFDMIGVIPAFLALIVIANAFFLSPAVVDGPSMQPTFYTEDAVIVYHFNVTYEEGDIIVFARGDKLLIKRLIGLPGDHLTVSADGVFLNGTLVEPFVGVPYIPYDDVIPEGMYFAMGDNRTVSTDCREFGLVSEADLLGVVLVKIDLF